MLLEVAGFLRRFAGTQIARIASLLDCATPMAFVYGPSVNHRIRLNIQEEAVKMGWNWRAGCKGEQVPASEIGRFGMWRLWEVGENKAGSPQCRTNR